MRWLRIAVAPLRRTSRWFRRHLPPLDFITLHYLYFIGTCLLGSVIFWGASTPPRSVSFTDSLFLVTSAMTEAGLNTVNLSELNTFQQALLFVLIIIGSTIFVSAFVVYIRLRAFEREFTTIAHEREKRRRRRRRFASRISLSRSGQNGNVDADPKSGVDGERTENEPVPSTVELTPLPAFSNLPFHRSEQGQSSMAMLQDSKNETNLSLRATSDPEIRPTELTTFQSAPYPGHIAFQENTVFHPHLLKIRSIQSDSQLRTTEGIGAQFTSSLRKAPQTRPSSSLASPVNSSEGKQPWEVAHIGRNSQFHHLTDAEREKLGGVEYKAVCFLAYLVPLYFVLWQLLGTLSLGAYVAHYRAETALQNGLNPFWVGAFNAVSAFNNSGMSLLDANMVAFQTAIYMLITMGLLILAGNTCYPIFLRLIIWTLKTIIPNNKYNNQETLNFLLNHPRRCYTNLFPAEHTWWLLFAVISLNGIDWVAYEILNIGNSKIDMPPGIKAITGLFQALAVRSGGFYVVSIGSVRIGLQVLYVLMMYVSVYPVVITMRNSNVYEERSLGIYTDDPGYNPNNPSNDPRLDWRGRFWGALRSKVIGDPEQSTKSLFLRQQLRVQLAHDLWWICLAVFLIMIVEGSNFDRDPANFSVFNVIFETVSAYGCVGISLGAPGQAYSFAGAMHTLSKLILCAVMLRGRHRGLPVAIDKAVLLPGEALHLAEEEDANIRLERNISRVSVA